MLATCYAEVTGKLLSWNLAFTTCLCGSESVVCERWWKGDECVREVYRYRLEDNNLMKFFSPLLRLNSLLSKRGLHDTLKKIGAYTETQT